MSYSLSMLPVVGLTTFTFENRESEHSTNAALLSLSLPKQIAKATPHEPHLARIVFYFFQQQVFSFNPSQLTSPIMGKTRCKSQFHPNFQAYVKWTVDASYQEPALRTRKLCVACCMHSNKLLKQGDLEEEQLLILDLKQTKP